MNSNTAVIGTNGTVTDLDIDSLMAGSFKTSAEVQQSAEPPTAAEVKQSTEPPTATSSQEDETVHPLDTDTKAVSLGWIDDYSALMTKMTGAPTSFHQLAGLVLEQWSINGCQPEVERQAAIVTARRERVAAQLAMFEVQS